jgi:hypothetical protein
MSCLRLKARSCLRLIEGLREVEALARNGFGSCAFGLGD